MTTNPWTSGVLPKKLFENDAGVILNASCTSLNAEGARRHIRATLKAGATRGVSCLVLKCASLRAIHPCSLGAPILLDEAHAAGVKPSARSGATPAWTR